MGRIITGEPLGSVLRTILFIIYLNKLVFLNKLDVSNFANDTTPFVCPKSLAELLGLL